MFVFFLATTVNFSYFYMELNVTIAYLAWARFRAIGVLTSIENWNFLVKYKFIFYWALSRCQRHSRCCLSSLVTIVKCGLRLNMLGRIRNLVTRAFSLVWGKRPGNEVVEYRISGTPIQVMEFIWLTIFNLRVPCKEKLTLIN